VLVRKDVPDARANADYAALEAPNEFLVGRGMDCDGAYRQLSGIYSLPPQAEEAP
jgi:hypoxanthine-guanine phosphoribosyltransferase